MEGEKTNGTVCEHWKGKNSDVASRSSSRVSVLTRVDGERCNVVCDATEFLMEVGRMRRRNDLSITL